MSLIIKELKDITKENNKIELNTQECTLTKKGLLIINSSGGLIYSSFKNKDVNQIMFLGSTIHSLEELANEFFDDKRHLLKLQYDEHTIYSYKTLSCISFIFLWDNSEPPFSAVYQHYAEAVAQNYFYRVGMPINGCSFDPKKYF